MQIAEEKDLLNKIQTITLAGNNELGNRTMNAINKYISSEDQEFKLIHLNLIRCQTRNISMLPLL